MSNDINRLRELAGIKQEPVKNKTEKLDEGVIGGMQEVRHVSVREDAEDDRYDKVLSALAAMFGPDIYDNSDVWMLVDDLESVNPTDQELDYIIQNKKMPPRLKGFEFRSGDTLQFGESKMEEDAPPGMEDWIKSNKERFKQQYGDDWEEILYATAWKMKNNESMEESNLDSFANSVDEEMLVGKEERIVNDAREMVSRGMDLDSVVMSLANEYGLSTEEQFDLYNMVIQEPVEEDEDQETMRGRQEWEMGDTEESHTVDWNEVKKAAADAAETIFGNVDYDAINGMIDDAKHDLDSSANTEDAVQVVINKMRQDESVDEDAKPDYIDLDNDGDTDETMKKAARDKEEVEEDFGNGYDKQVEVDADGYFPKGAHHSVSDDAGPSSAKHGDNAMQKKMDVTESKSIHHSLVSGYRKFKKS